MFPILIGGALLGAWAVQRTKPRSRVVRRSLIGPVTGATYDVEDFPAEGVMIVRTAGGHATATLARLTNSEGQTRLSWMSGNGHPAALLALRRDLCPAPPAQHSGAHRETNREPRQ